MSYLVTDATGRDVQAFRLPYSGGTTVVSVSVSNSSAPSGALQAGVYRIISDADVTVAAGPIATANDLPIRANQPEYFYINDGDQVSVYATVAPANVYLTRMP